MDNTNNNNNATSSGIGFVGVLTIVFIVLKLLGKIAWSWWWVLSPLWITIGLVFAIAVITFIIAIIVGYIGGFKEYKFKKHNK